MPRTQRLTERHVEQTRDHARLVQTLRDYVAARPRAGDNLQGIQRWWLAGFSPPPDEDALMRALRQLEADGWLTCRMVAGTPWWRSASNTEDRS